MTKSYGKYVDTWLLQLAQYYTVSQVQMYDHELSAEKRMELMLLEVEVHTKADGCLLYEAFKPGDEAVILVYIKSFLPKYSY